MSQRAWTELSYHLAHLARHFARAFANLFHVLEAMCILQESLHSEPGKHFPSTITTLSFLRFLSLQITEGNILRHRWDRDHDGWRVSVGVWLHLGSLSKVRNMTHTFFLFLILPKKYPSGNVYTFEPWLTWHWLMSSNEFSFSWVELSQLVNWVNFELRLAPTMSSYIWNFRPAGITDIYRWMPGALPSHPRPKALAWNNKATWAVTKYQRNHRSKMLWARHALSGYNVSLRELTNNVSTSFKQPSYVPYHLQTSSWPFTAASFCENLLFFLENHILEAHNDSPYFSYFHETFWQSDSSLFNVETHIRPTLCTAECPLRFKTLRSKPLKIQQTPRSPSNEKPK